ncbi:hypothetical protein B0F90DRAFT_1807897 [Multifurca ochricompacta]|uniref:FAD-binding FR-type domain-containing protein n=1 Tax=Multifurca ochricompacta TaxID=376703 RepID=A0AAD4MBU8_9AGAM|nr:hypothetical protein B0F90DRAFT_1807897 [Multifurca ochricompacta]
MATGRRLFIATAATATATATYFLWPPSSSKSRVELSPNRFIPVTIADKSKVGPDLAILTLTLTTTTLTSSTPSFDFDPIWSIFIKDDDIQVERPYTPLNGWIKMNYPNGQVAKWLHSKKIGDTIQIRGPLKSSFLPSNSSNWDEVVMISGGTGFSPFHQLLFHHLLQQQKTSPNSTPRFTLLHASHTPAELPPLPFLQPLIDFAHVHPELLRLRLFVNRLSDVPAHDTVARHIQVGRIDKSSIARSLGISDPPPTWSSFMNDFWKKRQPTVNGEDIRMKKVLVLVCGPESMVAAIAGPYGKNYSQGRLDGVLAELGFRPGQVWKL